MVWFHVNFSGLIFKKLLSNNEFHWNVIIVWNSYCNQFRVQRISLSTIHTLFFFLAICLYINFKIISFFFVKILDLFSWLGNSFTTKLSKIFTFQFSSQFATISYWNKILNSFVILIKFTSPSLLNYDHAKKKTKRETKYTNSFF